MIRAARADANEKGARGPLSFCGARGAYCLNWSNSARAAAMQNGGS